MKAATFRQCGLVALVALVLAATLLLAIATAPASAQHDPTAATGNGAQRAAAPDLMALLALQQVKLTPDSYTHQAFGYSLALSGDTALVGAPFNLDQGVAYVFVRSGSAWTQQQTLLAPDEVSADLFGYSVSLSGDTALVGALRRKVGDHVDQGAAYVYTRSGSVWSQEAELTASDGAGTNYFGSSVALSGDTALVGAPYHTVGGHVEQGAAYLFTGSGSSWAQQAELTAQGGAAHDNFGDSVALLGDTALVGAPDHKVAGHAQQGAAYLFRRIGPRWRQQGPALTASGGAASDQFGASSRPLRTCRADRRAHPRGRHQLRAGCCLPLRPLRLKLAPAGASSVERGRWRLR